ncbi:MAG: class I SAM-dependent RNA methyltransferase [Antricoccus sp.]
MAHGGHCVGRYDGRVIFVRHALPGERIRAQVTEDAGGSFCRADAIEILLAHAGRVIPPCRFAGPGLCGGCDWQHAAPATSRMLKAEVISEQLRRLAGIELAIEVEPLQPPDLRWRTRMQYAVDAGGHAGLRKHRSHDVLPIDDCLLAVPEATDGAILSKDWSGSRAIEVDVGLDQDRAVRSMDNRRRWHSVSGSAKSTRRTAAGRDWQVRAGGFWQVHPQAAQALVDTVLAMANPRPGDRVLDLYCGMGLFAAALGIRVGPTGYVLGLEADSGAVSDGQRQLADIPQVELRNSVVNQSRIQALAQGNTDHGEPAFDVVVLDPPRTGAKRDVCTAIAALAPSCVVYVACDPAALARDVQIFADLGFALQKIRAFDAFPMTHHVECVALLA